MTGLLNGSEFLDLGKGTVSRASGGFIPDTGRSVAANVPRTTPERIPYNTWRPKVYFTHSGLTQMRYNSSQDPANNLIDREATFFSQFPEFTKIQLGTSFQSRPINAFRLGPLSRKHFVVVQAIHGDEIDGVEGTFKAIQLLAREAEFQPFRDEWTIFFVTALNPDGWFLSTRNLAKVGPNGQTVNLNRNWDWFFDEYIETATESKGSAFESEVETQALLNYFRGTGPFAGQGAVQFGFLMDQHANQGVGKRYQSRDRVWRGTTNGPAQSPKPTTDLIPNSYLSIYIDFYTWRAAAAVTRLRVIEKGGPDFSISYRRSRFRPHMHSYFSSQSVPSIAIEEVKQASSTLESFSSAANYRMDYVLSTAAMVSSNFWRWEDAILVENAGRNLLKNANHKQWQPNDFRPGNYTTSRLSVKRNVHIPEQKPATVRHFDDSGEATTITSDTDIKLRANSGSADVPSEFTAAANAKLGVYCVISSAMTGLFKFDVDAQFDAGFAGAPDIVLSHSQRVGTALANAATDAVDIIGGGTAAPSTGAVTTISRVAGISNAVPVQSSPGSLNTARMFHAVADNFLGFPSGGGRTYIFGGFNGAGSRISSIEVWDPTLTTSTNSAVSIPGVNNLADAVAVFHPPTGDVYIFGGSDNVASTRTVILQYTPGSTPPLDTIATHATSMLVGLKYMAAAYSPTDGRIWIFGGELSSGAMSDKIYSFDPATGIFVEESISQNLDDDEDSEEGGQSKWVKLFGRWSAVTLVEFNGDSGLVAIPGGRETNTTGSLSAEVFQFDPVDEIIGLGRFSDYGYIRYSVAVAEREYEVNSTTTFPLKVTGITGRSYIDSLLNFAPSGATARFLELTKNVAGADLLRVSNVTGTIAVNDVVTADATNEDFQATVASIPEDNFNSGLDETAQWDDPDGAWGPSSPVGQASANTGTFGVASPLILRNGVDWENNRISVDLILDLDSNMPLEHAFVTRGTFSGSTLTDGYKIAYDGTAGTEAWTIKKVVASSESTLATLDVSADATRRVIEASSRTLVFTVEDRDPVIFNVTFNSLAIFTNIIDGDNDRIRTPGEVAIIGGLG